MYGQTLPQPSNTSQAPTVTPLTSNSGVAALGLENTPSGLWSGGVFLGSEESNFLIQGNKASTPYCENENRAFDDFKPDHSFHALKDRLTRYAAAHSRAVKMSEWISENIPYSALKKINLQSLRSDLETCGSFLIFRHFFTINTVKLAGMCSCHRHLLCPLCAIRRAAKSVKAYLDRFNVLQAENQNMRPYLVTFTVKDGENLTERFDHLQNSLRLYYSHRRKALSSKSRHLPNEACKALGGVGSFEVKRGSGSGMWHPHAHFIWLCNTPPDKGTLQQEWHTLTGDSFIVDVTPFHEGKNVSEGFLEVFKYALKTSTMEHSDNWEAFLVLKGRRLVSSFGIFRNVEVPEQLTDDFDESDLPFIEMIFRYLKGVYLLDSQKQVIPSTSQQASERSE